MKHIELKQQIKEIGIMRVSRLSKIDRGTIRAFLRDGSTTRESTIARLEAAVKNAPTR